MNKNPLVSFIESVPFGKPFALPELHTLHTEWCKENHYSPLTAPTLREAITVKNSVAYGMMQEVKRGSKSHYMRTPASAEA